MEQMVKKLYEAAVEGNSATLLHLLHQDPLILDRCIATSYEETPLHVAAMLGHLEFCSELLRRKPKLAGELDYRRSSALHLASAKGHVEIVKILACVKPEMCLAYDGYGRNPIHVAAMKGKVDVLKTLMGIHPDAARAKVRIHQGENVLHLCVQYYQLEALMCLVEAMSDQEFVNAKDDNGNSILDLAMVDKQVEIIEYLVSKTQIDIDSKYLDISQCLQHSKVRKSQETYSNVAVERNKRVTTPKETGEEPKGNSTTKGSYFSKQSAWLEAQRESLMVVAILIATMAFQANFAPLGGFWQDYSKGNSTTGEPLYKAGDSVLAYVHPKTYRRFMIANTTGFISSLIVILLLISGLPFIGEISMWFLMLFMWISISATAFTFAVSMANSSEVLDILEGILIIWTLMMGSLIAWHTIQLVGLTTKRCRPKLKILVWTVMLIEWISVIAITGITLFGITRPSKMIDYVVKVVEIGVCGYGILIVTLIFFQFLLAAKKIKIKRRIGAYWSSNPPLITQLS